MTPQPERFIGIDLGTQGVRVIVTDPSGHIQAHANHTFRLEPNPATHPHFFEQDPREWWTATATCLRQVTSNMDISQQRNITALAVTATSGTICLLDATGTPVAPAIMYSDRRAHNEATIINTATPNLTARYGYQFAASFGLPKLLWMHRHQPETVTAARFFAHAADVLTGHLTGDYATSDWSHALKSGYDVQNLCWPHELFDTLSLPREKFPRVVAPGTIIGNISPQAAEDTGLPQRTVVVAGMTDSCTAQIAGGAVEPGQWMSVLGTTLAIKGVTTDLLHDPAGRIYSHRHPMGIWMPGGASNTGGEVLARQFAGEDLAQLDRQAARIIPTDLLCYPLERTGERFPFAHPNARSFLIGNAPSRIQYYTACLEGVGYIERMAYDVLSQIGAPMHGALRATGGGARSQTWLQIRANILNRPIEVPEQTEAAYGAAVLAAGACAYPDSIAATQAMVRVREHIEPDSVLVEKYAARYAQFLHACRERGYG